MAHVFESSGGSVTHTGRSGDGGVDIEINRDGQLVVVQCKRFRTPVGPGPVRELLGVLNARSATHGVLVSTSGFTDGAHRLAKAHPIALLDGNQLAELAQSLDPRMEGKGARSFAPWPAPSRLGPWVSLSVSASTPRFVARPPMPITRLLLTGMGYGLAGGFIFLIGLGIWAASTRTLLPVALLSVVAVIAIGLGTKHARNEDAQRTPECSACHHQSHAHRLAAFSPYRLRLTCRECTRCDVVLPDPIADSATGPLRPLLYLMPPADGTVTIERATEAQEWARVATLGVRRWRSPVLLTDAGGVKATSKYRFRFEPTSPARAVATDIRMPAAAAKPEPSDQRCPKCRRRLRLSRHWTDGHGFWACWTCGYSSEADM